MRGAILIRLQQCRGFLEAPGIVTRVFKQFAVDLPDAQALESLV
jgi:hypothetical protein